MNLSEQEHFQEMYGRYFHRLVRYFERAFHVPEEDAHELAQETFIRFYRGMTEYRGDAEWAFLQMVAHRVAINRIRSVRTKKRGALEESLEGSADAANVAGAESPEDEFLARESAENVRRAVARLPPAMRQCVQLWIDGFKYEEIASVLRISVDAVKSRLRDARRRLREELAGESQP